MDDVIKFLQTHKDVALATVDHQGNPAVRLFQIMKMEGKNLFFATTEHKETYLQLKHNPNAEILAYDGNVSVRATGRVQFDVDDDLGRKIFEENPVLGRLYHNHKELVYFRLPMQKADYYDLTPTPPLLKTIHFE